MFAHRVHQFVGGFIQECEEQWGQLEAAHKKVQTLLVAPHVAGGGAQASKGMLSPRQLILPSCSNVCANTFKLAMYV